MNLRTISTVILVGLLGGCATATDWSPTGGSRSDGIVEMSYELPEYANPKQHDSQTQKMAAQRCRSWGYQDAEPFGGIRRQCQQTGGFSGCMRWFVTMEYQCLDGKGEYQVKAPSSSAQRPTQSQLQSNLAEYGRLGYTAEKLAMAIGCDRTLKPVSSNPEVYQTQCQDGATRYLRCEGNDCHVAY